MFSVTHRTFPGNNLLMKNCRMNEIRQKIMYTLSNNDIEKISHELISILESAKISSQGCTKARLTAEELLLKYQEKFDSETELSLHHTKRLGKVTVTLKVRCESFDPMANLSDEDFWLQNILQSLGYVPTWKYKNNCNELCFPIRIESRLSMWACTLIACGLGIIFGLAARLLPGETLSVLSDKFFAPVSSAIMGFLGTVSAMLIFLSIINGIVNMGNIATLNRLGKKLISLITLSMLTLGAILIIVFGLIFPVSGSTGSRFDITSLWSMILDIIPSSFIDPLNGGNALQILFLAFVIGFIMLRSADILSPVIDVMRGLYQIVQDMMVLVLKVLPLVVFISLFNLISGVSDIDLRAVYKYPLLQLVLSLAWLAALILIICIRHKVKLSVLVKKLLPTFLIGLSTASSNAALSTSMEDCEKKLGITPSLVKVGIPLTHLIDKPAAMIMFISGTTCMAQMFSVDISWSSLITMTLAVFLLAIAAPAVAGSGISMMTLLFTMCGIPPEALSIIIALDVITDRIVTSSIVTNAQLDMIRIANSLGELDKDVLRS